MGLFVIGSEIRGFTCVSALSDDTVASFSAAMSREHQQVPNPSGINQSLAADSVSYIYI